MNGGGASLSFPKSIRLLRRREFRKVYEEGRRRGASVCVIYYLSTGLARTRVGITTPKALGNAVLRNRIRRRLREVIRLNQAVIPPGWDLVLNPRRAAAKVAFPTLIREILRILPQEKPPTPSARPRG